MMRTIDDYMSLNYRMEIVEDKEEVPRGAKFAQQI